MFHCRIRSESFSIRTSKGGSPASELVLLRGGLAPAFRDCITRGNLESKTVYRGQGRSQDVSLRGSVFEQSEPATQGRFGRAKRVRYARRRRKIFRFDRT